MSKQSYSFPKSPTAQLDFQANAIDLSVTNATEWGVPDTVLALLAPLRTTYEGKSSVANNKTTRSTAAVADRDAAWQALVLPLTELYDQHLMNNPAISAAHKAALHINVGKAQRVGPTPTPTTTPIVVLVAEEASILHVVFTDSASSSGSHAKPSGVAFCEVVLKIDGAAPALPTDCTEKYNIARNREAIVFQHEQRTKTVYGFARWINKNGKIGVWSNPFSAIIP